MAMLQSKDCMCKICCASQRNQELSLKSNLVGTLRFIENFMLDLLSFGFAQHPSGGRDINSKYESHSASHLKGLNVSNNFQQ